MCIKIPNSLAKLAQSASVPIYIVGGYVRNMLCGLGQTDIDICGSLPAHALGLPSEFRITTVNFRLGTALISIDGDDYEYTPFRVENYSGGAHSPTAIFLTDDINKDCARRDFACNAVYYDIRNQKLVDIAGGVEDIKNRLLRAVSSKTFTADGLRILRLVRIAAQTGFRLDGRTVESAVSFLHYLREISPERIRQELEYILVADTKYGVENGHYRGLRLLGQLGIFGEILPEVADMKGVAQNPQYHVHDVFDHTLMCVRNAPPQIRRAALFHDIGKPESVKLNGNMHGHELVSAAMTRQIMTRLRYSNAEIAHTARLVELHMYDLMGNTRSGKLRLFVAKNYDIIEELVALKRADGIATGMPDAPRADRFLPMLERMREEGTPLTLSELAINGQHLLDVGISGQAIGKILAHLHQECILNPRLNNVEWLMNEVERVRDSYEG